jgi:Protein of unknown function (DUF669)
MSTDTTYEDDGFSLADEMAAFGDELLGKAYPAGEYDIEVTKATAAKTAGGKPCLKTVNTILAGPLKGKTVPDQLNWSAESDIAARIFAQTMAKMGATQDWIKQTRPKMPQLAQKITGAKLHVVFTVDDWNGSPRNKIQYRSTIALPGGNGAAPSTSAAADLDAEDLGNQGSSTPPASDDAVNLDWP